MDEVSASFEKVEATLGWEKLTSVKEIRNFLEKISYYCRFIEEFSNRVAHLTWLTKKNIRLNRT